MKPSSAAFTDGTESVLPTVLGMPRRSKGYSAWSQGFLTLLCIFTSNLDRIHYHSTANVTILSAAGSCETHLFCYIALRARGWQPLFYATCQYILKGRSRSRYNSDCRHILQSQTLTCRTVKYSSSPLPFSAAALAVAAKSPL